MATEMIHNQASFLMDAIVHRIRARFPLIYVVSSEEWRVLTELFSVRNQVDSNPRSIRIWSAVDGIQTFDDPKTLIGKDTPKPDSRTTDPMVALDQVLETNPREGVIYVFRDLHPYLNESDGGRLVIRRLRDVAMRMRRTRNTLILLSPYRMVPRELDSDMAVVEFPLPTLQDMARKVDATIQLMERKPEARLSVLPPGKRPEDFIIRCSETDRREIARGLSGLTYFEAEDVLYKAMADLGGIHPGMVQLINREKKHLLNRSPSLESIEPDVSFDDIGGLDALVTWLRARRRLLSPRAAERGITWSSKGFLAFGLPGTGKSLVAKATASEFKLPLIRWNISALFGSLMGETEKNFAADKRRLESAAPAVVWVDELDDATSGAGTGGRSDGGLLDRLISELLHWQQERRCPLFFIYTANDIERIPDPLIRKGRLDEIFFLGLPGFEERKHIFTIHLRKVGIADSARHRINVEELAEMTHGYVGAEIEHVVKEACFKAFSDSEDLREAGRIQEADRRLLQMSDLTAAIQETRPISETMEDKVNRIMDEWVGKQRARLASSSASRIVALSDPSSIANVI